MSSDRPGCSKVPPKSPVSYYNIDEHTCMGLMQAATAAANLGDFRFDRCFHRLLSVHFTSGESHLIGMLT